MAAFSKQAGTSGCFGAEDRDVGSWPIVASIPRDATGPFQPIIHIARQGVEPSYITTCAPSSMTRFEGIRKKAVALLALRNRVMKISSRQ